VVREVQRENRQNGRFTAITGEHEFAADALVVATGGLSIPKMGQLRSATNWRASSA